MSKIIAKVFFPPYQSTLSGFKETHNLRNNNEAMRSATALPLSLGRIDHKVILKSEQKASVYILQRAYLPGYVYFTGIRSIHFKSDG